MFDRLISLVLEFIGLFRFCVVLRPFEAGVVLRVGRFKRVIGPGGLHWLLPFNIDDYIYTNIVPETSRVGPQSLVTKDEVEVVVSSVVTWAVGDVIKYLLEIEGAEQVIEDCAYGYVNEFIHAHTWAELMGMDISAKLTTLVRRRAKDFGVSIIRVQLADLTRCPSIRLLTSRPQERGALIPTSDL